ncbi:hypothetical protein [Methylovirgula sp. 4M-Z18]|uniref:hypothetical protein n=1 Tax=Methylovirgula sp. 4M-Z18 TaxID=2293567 RepID=UPI000E2FEA57|nr:hypothetical protein [Methylovirgula sp. 4M-Z18]RFB80380.1 hypothetical protein DYH55_02310 [Methylovirgula sp. 4M-Z18]
MTEEDDVKKLQKLSAKLQAVLAGNDIHTCISLLMDSLATALAISADTPEQVDQFIDDHFMPELKQVVRTKIAAIQTMQSGRPPERLN